MKFSNKDYKVLINHYERCFNEHGDSHKGVDWPNPEDAKKRYSVMYDVIEYDRYNVTSERPIILDIGCGAGHFLDYINIKHRNASEYIGHDISEIFIEHCKKKYQDYLFLVGDILESNFHFPGFDYAVMNGVFTEKRELSFDDMLSFFQAMVSIVFKNASKGIAFNVMSKNVDWERDDLFHVPLDLLTEFITKKISRNFVIRNDYGLYEYTVYIYK